MHVKEQNRTLQRGKFGVVVLKHEIYYFLKTLWTCKSWETKMSQSTIAIKCAVNVHYSKDLLFSKEGGTHYLVYVYI